MAGNCRAELQPLVHRVTEVPAEAHARIGAFAGSLVKAREVPGRRFSWCCQASHREWLIIPKGACQHGERSGTAGGMRRDILRKRRRRL